MTFIIIMTIIIYLLVIAWSWTSLGDTSKAKKILIIFIGMITIFLITQIVFSMSKSGINYENEEIENWVGKIIVFLFTGLNGFVMPFLMKLFKKLQNGEIEGNIFKVRFILISIIFILCLFLECGYMESIQQGILKVYRANIEN